MTPVSKLLLTSSLVTMCSVLAMPAFADPFTLIRIGDIDGFGFGAGAGLIAANGGSVNVGVGGTLGAETLPTIGDFLPDLDGSGDTGPFSGDDFDNRSGAEALGAYVEGQGFTDAGTTGSDYTDISLSQSYNTSSGANAVFDANTSTYGAGGAFPDGSPGTLPNQPGFVFDFGVAGADIASGTQLYFNMLFGDYGVTPASLQFTRGDGTMFAAAVTPQNNAAGQDGLIQSAFAVLNFSDVFTANGGNWDGYLRVDFLAPNEPYTAFDFVEISLAPIGTTPVPEPATLLLLGTGLAAAAARRRRHRKP